MSLSSFDEEKDDIRSNSGDLLKTCSLQSSNERDDVNILVMTDSGKPIFARYGSEEEVARTCGLLQALRSSVLYSQNLNLGEIQSLQAGTMRLVFMQDGAITLVALAHDEEQNDDRPKNHRIDTELYLRLQLEYVYAHILLALTSQVQTMLQQNASLDLRSWLGSTSESTIKSFLRQSSHLGDPAPLLLGSLSSLFPVRPSLRHRASLALQQVAAKTENTVFALIFTGAQVLTLVQPNFVPHHMRVSDLHLLLHFLNRQPDVASSSSELWIPVCLPRFCATGFLYCYTHCLDVKNKLILSFLSTQGTTEQFAHFRKASSIVRQKLGIECVSEGGIIASATARSPGNDKLQHTNNTNVDFEDDDDSEGYVDIANIDDAISSSDVLSNDGDFLSELTFSFREQNRRELIKGYLELANASHFMFRLSVPTHNVNSHKKDGKKAKSFLNQCVSSDVVTNSDQDQLSIPTKDLYIKYQELMLRLKHGSASVDSLTSGVKRSVTADLYSEQTFEFSAMHASEINYPAERLVCDIAGSLAFVAMNGHNFELYMVMSSMVDMVSAAAAGARLAKQLLSDQDQLFMTHLLFAD